MKHDLERAARLAATQFATDVESAVEAAVETVAGEGPLYYSEDEVRQLLQYVLCKEDIEAELEAALGVIRR